MKLRLKKIAFITALIVPVVLPAYAAAWGGDKPVRNITLVIDNAVTSPTTKPETTEDVNLKVLKYAVQFRDKDHDVRLNVIYTSMPTAIAFSGTQRDLKKQVGFIRERTTNIRTCSDLQRAYMTALTKQNLTQAPVFDLVVVSPHIAVPFPCDGEGELLLPQPVKDAMGLQDLAKVARSIMHFMVEGEQLQMLEEFYQRNGLLNAPLSKETTSLTHIKVIGVAETTTLLNNKDAQLF